MSGVWAQFSLFDQEIGQFLEGLNSDKLSSGFEVVKNKTLNNVNIVCCLFPSPCH